MLYPTNVNLPQFVRAHLPDHAQDIYREAFNHAFVAHAGEAHQEERAHRRKLGPAPSVMFLRSNGD
ncbi:MAG TPA: ChaB family protein [Xanthobacteraceae bacterium]|nr:ChaB family protein [Xanthobacteraceae bacterium]